MGVSPIATLGNYIVHREITSQLIDGLVIGPADLRTLDLLFTVACSVQTGKLPPIPIVLLGDAWHSIVAGLERAMLQRATPTISPDDLGLFSICDTVEEALSAVSQKHQ